MPQDTGTHGHMSVTLPLAAVQFGTHVLEFGGNAMSFAARPGGAMSFTSPFREVGETIFSIRQPDGTLYTDPDTGATEFRAVSQISRDLSCTLTCEAILGACIRPTDCP